MATVPSELSESAVIPKTRIDQFTELPTEKKLGLMVATAAIIAIIMGAWMWSQTPDYRVLYSNISDQDGGEIVSTYPDQDSLRLRACLDRPTRRKRQYRKYENSTNGRTETILHGIPQLCASRDSPTRNAARRAICSAGPHHQYSPIEQNPELLNISRNGAECHSSLLGQSVSRTVNAQPESQRRAGAYSRRHGAHS